VEDPGLCTVGTGVTATDDDEERLVLVDEIGGEIGRRDGHLAVEACRLSAAPSADFESRC
jgi:hypothetical protein